MSKTLNEFEAQPQRVKAKMQRVRNRNIVRA